MKKKQTEDTAMILLNRQVFISDYHNVQKGASSVCGKGQQCLGVTTHTHTHKTVEVEPSHNNNIGMAQM